MLYVDHLLELPSSLGTRYYYLYLTKELKLKRNVSKTTGQIVESGSELRSLLVEPEPATTPSITFHKKGISKKKLEGKKLFSITSLNIETMYDFLASKMYN